MARVHGMSYQDYDAPQLLNGRTRNLVSAPNLYPAMEHEQSESARLNLRSVRPRFCHAGLIPRLISLPLASTLHYLTFSLKTMKHNMCGPQFVLVLNWRNAGTSKLL